MRSGVDRQTGKLLTGWDHCVQSLQVILSTRMGSLQWRRRFGASVNGLVDRNAASRTILEFYRDVAEAIAKDEPGFRLESIELISGGRNGVFRFDLAGIFYPRGHLGDYSISQRRQSETQALLPGGVELVQ